MIARLVARNFYSSWCVVCRITVAITVAAITVAAAAAVTGNINSPCPYFSLFATAGSGDRRIRTSSGTSSTRSHFTRRRRRSTLPLAAIAIAIAIVFVAGHCVFWAQHGNALHRAL